MKLFMEFNRLLGLAFAATATAEFAAAAAGGGAALAGGAAALAGGAAGGTVPLAGGGADIYLLYPNSFLQRMRKSSARSLYTYSP